MRKVRCRNCGALQDVPDYHGPLHIKCKTCEWQETLPPRRALPEKLTKDAGAAFSARQQELRQRDEALSHLADLPPREFEQSCGRLYERHGFVVAHADAIHEQTHAFELRMGDELTLLACRRAGARPVDVIDVENLSGAMRHDKAAGAIFITTGTFAEGCQAIADEAGIELIDGDALHERLAALDPAELAEVLPLEEE